MELKPNQLIFDNKHLACYSQAKWTYPLVRVKEECWLTRRTAPCPGLDDVNGTSGWSAGFKVHLSLWRCWGKFGSRHRWSVQACGAVCRRRHLTARFNMAICKWICISSLPAFQPVVLILTKTFSYALKPPNEGYPEYEFGIKWVL